MKGLKIAIIVIAAVLLLGLIGSSVGLISGLRDKLGNTNKEPGATTVPNATGPTTDDPFADDDPTPDNPSGGNAPEVIDPDEDFPSFEPEDTVDYSSFMMNSKPALCYSSEGVYDVGIRFTANISTALYNRISASTIERVGILIAPLDYFNSVSSLIDADTGWIEAFKSKSMSYIATYPQAASVKNENGGVIGYQYSSVLSNVLYQNVNRPFTAIGFIESKVGEVTSYTYAGYTGTASYKTSAKSLAVLAGDYLNQLAVNNYTLSDERMSYLYTVINDSVDNLNGLASPTADGSKYSLTLSTGTGSNHVTSTESKLQLVPKLNPTWNTSFEVVFTSDDKSIATVSSTGEVTFKTNGQTFINCYVAGVKTRLNVACGYEYPGITIKNTPFNSVTPLYVVYSSDKLDTNDITEVGYDCMVLPGEEQTFYFDEAIFCFTDENYLDVKNTNLTESLVYLSDTFAGVHVGIYVSEVNALGEIGKIEFSPYPYARH